MVLSDEMYEYIIFEGESRLIWRHSRHARAHHHRERLLQELRHDRLAPWLCSSADPIARAMARMQSAFTAGANSFVQRAAIAALEAPRDDVEPHA